MILTMQILRNRGFIANIANVYYNFCLPMGKN